MLLVKLIFDIFVLRRTEKIKQDAHYSLTEDNDLHNYKVTPKVEYLHFFNFNEYFNTKPPWGVNIILSNFDKKFDTEIF